MKNRETDRDILELLDRNIEEGFGLLLERYQEPLYWHIRRLVVSHTDAEDVTQEVFIRVFRSIAGFKGGSSLATWLYRIATNESMRHLERNRQKACDIDTHLALHSAEEYIDLGDLEAVAMQRAVATLPPKQQLVFNLCYYDSLNYQQVGEIVGCSALAAKSNYHLAKRRVEKFLLDSIE